MTTLKPDVCNKLRRFDDPPRPNDWQWDFVRRVTLRRTGETIRHRLLIKPEHVGIRTLTMGTVKQHDVGRELIVDVPRTGITVDYIQDPKPPSEAERQQALVVAHVRGAIAKYEALLDELGVLL